jgi:hypothetical protein
MSELIIRFLVGGLAVSFFRDAWRHSPSQELRWPLRLCAFRGLGNAGSHDPQGWKSLRRAGSEDHAARVSGLSCVCFLGQLQSPALSARYIHCRHCATAGLVCTIAGLVDGIQREVVRFD